MFLVIRENDLKTTKWLDTYNSFQKLITKQPIANNIVKIQYYHNMLEIDMTIDTYIDLSTYKSIIYKLNQQCSSKIIKIFQFLYPDHNSIRIFHKDFLEFIKIFKNIKIKTFDNDITKTDLSKFDELTSLIRPKSYFIYKYLKLYKRNLKKTTNHKNVINISFANIPISITELQAIKFLRAYDPTFETIINKCRINTIKTL